MALSRRARALARPARAPACVRESAPRALLALALCLLALACRSSDRIGRPARWPTPSAGAVASEHPLATQAALTILDRGGNAADAAVAAALVLAVVHPQAGNLGGGGFALWVPHAGAARAFDFRETAPAAVKSALYLDARGARVNERSLRGPYAVGVPGSPLGLWTLRERCGSGVFSFAELAAPAIELAQRGFAVDPALARDLAQPGVREQLDPSARALFFPGGEPLRAGATLRQPTLAQTLSLLANEGPDSFYRGRLGAELVRAIDDLVVPGTNERARGWITAADLAAYRVEEREPLSGWFRGYQILTMPPPSSGGVVLLQVLGILEGLPLDAERDRTRNEQDIARSRGEATGERGLSERMLHWWIESLRCAFADRAQHLGDPAFTKVPLAELLSSAWISNRRIHIGERAQPSVAAWVPHEGRNTTHLSVLDRNGNALSLTTTLNETFGSGSYVRALGFLLNNEMDDFALAENSPNLFGLVGGAANAPAPGKRPLSSMTPTVLREGGNANVLVLGSPGGPRIITAVLQVILRATVLGEPLDEAIARPRLHQQWSPQETFFEPGFDPRLIEALRSLRGHPTKVESENFGAVEAIQLNELGGLPRAVSDPRRGGGAAVQSPRSRRTQSTDGG